MNAMERPGDDGSAHDRRARGPLRGGHVGAALLRGGSGSSTPSAPRRVNQRATPLDAAPRGVRPCRPAGRPDARRDRRQSLATLPDDRTPSKADWTRLSRRWRAPPRAAHRRARTAPRRPRRAASAAAACRSRRAGSRTARTRSRARVREPASCAPTGSRSCARGHRREHGPLGQPQRQRPARGQRVVEVADDVDRRILGRRRSRRAPPGSGRGCAGSRGSRSGRTTPGSATSSSGRLRRARPARAGRPSSIMNATASSKRHLAHVEATCRR